MMTPYCVFNIYALNSPYFWVSVVVPIIFVVMLITVSASDQTIGQIICTATWYSLNIYIMVYGIEVVHPKFYKRHLVKKWLWCLSLGDFKCVVLISVLFSIFEATVAC
eukprot:GHVR01120558.1.p1 GENE.GHVR01120558.1~~GHVR01120558.1.p1  ORF type:complete len:108 (-),score=14.34 GHVR01120558.1:101-424(-)